MKDKRTLRQWRKLAVHDAMLVIRRRRPVHCQRRTIRSRAVEQHCRPCGWRSTSNCEVRGVLISDGKREGICRMYRNRHTSWLLAIDKNTPRSGREHRNESIEVAAISV